MLVVAFDHDGTLTRPPIRDMFLDHAFALAAGWRFLPAVAVTPEA